MFMAYPRRGLSVAAAVTALVLASCATPEPEPAPAPPPPPSPPPAVNLNEGVAQAASIYVAFMREVGTIRAGFDSAEAIQAAIRKGASYEPAQLSRGMIAYGSILALQSPEFVQGVRTYAADPVQRQQMIARILADPAAAATFPGADAAAGLIVDTIGRDSAAMMLIAEAVEEDAYTIQGRGDPRRRWATVHISDRVTRLEGAKSLSAVQMLPSAEESARLFAAANNGSGLGVGPARSGPPYTPAVIRSLAVAALAALGAGGDDARASTEALTVEQNSEFCLNMSKLMLFQCLAASRPSYEDMFCVGRHVARDLATCTAQNITPAPPELPLTAVAGGAPEQTPVAAEAAAASTAATASLNNGG
ncbi:hypothetical protein [Brevundimonas sp. Root1423]|uniref:hypothetical protein n=2 Tax=unclassified Brevundimonas TaxID=2622653 RepID=UPI0006F8E09C|nr:hypothetical protein [Brevundimonas sp. Root1423]KQY87897.1 hypothetical protein ASD25_21445 [Brevundimonas sp. Root1423]KRA22915.1 hypothetical protein ASD59_09860 [Brevundimonas sp. Root608]